MTSKNNRGFTLIELLVTVAIIGILATVGVPMYRRMVANAKKSEAKVNLGLIAGLESLFINEYQVYGTNLLSMGFLIDVTPLNATYTMGFMTAGCANAANLPPAAFIPWGVALNLKNPTYYTVGNFQTAFGRTGRTNCALGLAAQSLPAVGNNYTTYTAVASGTIQQGSLPDAAAAVEDVWSINEQRTLINNVDGS